MSNNAKFIIPVAIALAAIAPFLQSLNYNFLLEWDDGGFVLQNPFICMSWDNLKHNFSSTLQSVYTPICTLSLMIDYYFFGNNAFGYHLHNLILYGICAAFIYLIMQEVKIPSALSIMIALLWSWNPCRIETVAWIAERKGVLSAALVFIAFWLFLRKSKSSKGSIIAGVLLFLAILTKPWTIPMLGIMVVYICCSRQIRWKIKFEILRYPLCCGILGSIISIAVSLRELTTNTSSSNLITQTVNFLRYAGSSFLPDNLNPIHPVFADNSDWFAAILGIVVFVLLITLAVITKMPRQPLLGMVLIVIGTAIPVLNSGKFTNADYADRYNFFISATLWLSLGLMLRVLWIKHPQSRKFLYIIFPILATYYILYTRSYLPVFSDSKQLFNYAVTCSIPNSKAIEGLALVGRNRREPELLNKAGMLFISKSRKSPIEANRNYNSGLMLLTLSAVYSNNGTAVHNYFAQANINPIFPVVYSATIFMPDIFFYYANLLLIKQQKMEAVNVLQKMVDQKLGNRCDLLFAVGLIKYISGDINQAKYYWQSSLKQNPDDHKIKHNLNKVNQILAEQNR